MKRTVETWSVEKLQKHRAMISFPEYQREPNLWSDDKKSLLIDSILVDIDIPKLYFNRTTGGTYEVIDGQQRLWAVWNFLDEGYPYRKKDREVKTGKRFSQLAPQDRKIIMSYEFQVTVLQEADDEYLRQLFIRLQLGLLLITGEKLHAATGAMRRLVFDKLAKQDFIRNLGIPKRRYARETLCAQLCINSFSRAKLNEFARTRYEDLEHFFKQYEHPQGKDLTLFQDQSKRISRLLDKLGGTLGTRASWLKNRSYILSVYLLAEELETRGNLTSVQTLKQFAEFALTLWVRLKEESAAGFDRSNEELYRFESLLSSAPGEKYQIERRHEKMLDYYFYFVKTDKILGDA